MGVRAKASLEERLWGMVCGLLPSTVSHGHQSTIQRYCERRDDLGFSVKVGTPSVPVHSLILQTVLRSKTSGCGLPARQLCFEKHGPSSWGTQETQRTNRARTAGMVAAGSLWPGQNPGNTAELKPGRGMGLVWLVQQASRTVWCLVWEALSKEG